MSTCPLKRLALYQEKYGHISILQGECRGNAATVLTYVNVTVALRSLASAVSSLTQYTDTVHYFPNHAKSQSGLTSILRAKLLFGFNKKRHTLIIVFSPTISTVFVKS